MDAEEKVARLVSADAVLVLRCQANDIEAFDEIVTLYKDGIYNYIWRMVSSREDAEDIAQDVFVRAFGAIKTFRRESNLRTWLYRIATNLCVDRYRRRGLEKQLFVPIEHGRKDEDGQPQAFDLPDLTNEPQRMYENTELQREIQQALMKMPEKLRSALLLFDFEGLSYDEIAETVSCPVGTVKSRIFNARVQLRDLLRAYVDV